MKFGDTSEVFGVEKENGNLEGILAAVYQNVFGQELMLQLKRAESENRLDQRLKFFTRQKLLIIDEIGYINLDKEDANLFFQLISRRYEQRSTIITTNKNLSKWSTIFGDPVIANAILDRLLHHSHIVSIVGPSYRIKDVMDSFEN